MSPKLPVSTSLSQILKVWNSNKEAEKDIDPQVPLTKPSKLNFERKINPI
jgi:hypothetical protein